MDSQIARNLSGAEVGFPRRKKLLVDRDANISEEFRAKLEQGD